MSSEITLDGKKYVSSKQAATETGYAQDYIGQLARGQHIDARRIGGLWYVNVDSLKQYKEKADSYVPTPPQKSSNDAESFVSLDGTDYISANRASEITGYTQDYVGQLARSGTLLATQIGTRWYVAKESILKHRKEKDDLLAAVQVESVGIARPTTTQRAEALPSSPEPHFRYSNEPVETFPSLQNTEKETGKQEEAIEEAEEVPIRVIPQSNSVRIPPPIATRPVPRTERVYVAPPEPVYAVPEDVIQPKKRSYSTILSVGAVVLIVITAGLIALQSSPSYTNTGESQTANTGSIGARILNFIESVLTFEIVYKRSE